MACGPRYVFVALPRPASPRLVFRPARRVSWATRIFAILVLVLAAGAIGAFLEVVLPQRVAQLAQSESSELAQARTGAADSSTAVATLWTEISAKGGIGLSPDQLTKDLALAKATEKSADDALSHIQAAQSYMAQADGLPFQFHSPSFIATDRPALQHAENQLEKAEHHFGGHRAKALELAKQAEQELKEAVAWADAHPEEFRKGADKKTSEKK